MYNVQNFYYYNHQWLFFLDSYFIDKFFYINYYQVSQLYLLQYCRIYITILLHFYHINYKNVIIINNSQFIDLYINNLNLILNVSSLKLFYNLFFILCFNQFFINFFLHIQKFIYHNYSTLYWLNLLLISV